MKHSLTIHIALLALAATSVATAAHAPRAVLADAVVDLRTVDGLGLVGGTWRYHDAAIVEVDHRAVGPDLKATGPANRTHDIAPHAHAADFDDSSWPVIPGDSLEARRTDGRLSFGWYRLSFTVPENLGAFATTGSTAVLELVVDDYAEIWVDGKLTPVLGSESGALASGWNSVQRVVLDRDLQPGRRINIAVFAANGPLSDPPANYVWIRSATLDFYRGDRLAIGHDVPLTVDRLDARLDSILGSAPKLEWLAGGFAFTEGPVWFHADDGFLLFSDPNNNRIYRWSPKDGEVSVYRTKSGYSGVDIGRYRQPGSNGLALDTKGRLVIAEHGNRRISRLEPNGLITVLADSHLGRRLNSPNDLIYRSDGTLFFTDPFFGLPGFDKDPARELPFTGVFALHPNGHLQLVTDELTGPNGIALSPDEKHLYVGNWDDGRKVVMRYTLTAGDSVATREVFADLTADAGDDAIDGVKVDTAGNVYVSGPGGLWIFASDGTRLGKISGPEHPHNMAWGDADHRTLYLTAQNGLYRLRLNIPGSGATLHHSP